MTHLLIKLFIHNSEDINDKLVRKKYGFLSSVVGIVCNVILFAVKYMMGIMSGAVSIISDAFNNLSDAGNCILTIFGYKMASKPADKDHPFGHGRMEYLISLIVAAIIMLVGFELLKSSVDKIIHPTKIEYSTVILVALVVSILVKLWMSLFNNFLGKKINSSIMLATAKDSRNDVVATVASVIALVFSQYTDVPIDGIMGILVSLFILYGGYGIIKDTVDELIGKPADKETVERIKQIILADKSMLGVHDIVIHSYGPGVTFGSIHVEVDCKSDIMAVHDSVDMLEREVYDELDIILTIHMDPVDTEDKMIEVRRQMVDKIIHEIDEKLSFHDFRMVAGPTHTNLVFDVVIPFDCKIGENEIIERINKALDMMDEKFYAVVSIDREYT